VFVWGGYFLIDPNLPVDWNYAIEMFIGHVLHETLFLGLHYVLKS